jgi:hypothetical protein
MVRGGTVEIRQQRAPGLEQRTTLEQVEKNLLKCFHCFGLVREQHSRTPEHAMAVLAVRILDGGDVE